MGIIDSGMTANKLSKAKTHVYNVCTLGQNIELIKPATKDEMGTHLTESKIYLKAHPVRFSPFERDVVEKISWTENVDILCYVSKLEVDNKSLTLNKLKKRYKKMRHNNKTYDIRYIEHYLSFRDDYLYIVIGGKV
ncbi:MAG: hypothetical protein ACFFG0_02570 [Candidatus Thorarchaeota archaeon]